MSTSLQPDGVTIWSGRIHSSKYQLPTTPGLKDEKIKNVLFRRVKVNVKVKSLYDKKTKWFQETRLSWEHWEHFNKGIQSLQQNIIF